jgi:hypothetical protein
MANMRKYAGSSYITLDDVADHSIKATIIEVTQGSFDKPVLLLDDGRRFSINATNCKTLIAAYGEESDDWIDKEVEIGAGKVKFQDRLQPSAVLKAITAPTPFKERTASTQEPPDDDIPL